MSNRTAFITGATGFIGRHVVDEFIDHGWRLIALTHRRVSAHLARYAASGHVTVIHGDAASSALGDLLSGHNMDVVIHVAGRASDVGTRQAFRKANYEAVQNVARIAMAAGARFVHTSSTDVYGLRDFNGQAEDELPLSHNRNNPYPEFKIAAEAWIRRNLPADRYCILRPAAVWGPDDTTLTLRFADFLRTSPFIVHFGKWRGRNRWPLAHVRNVAMAAYEAAIQPESVGQAINILDDEHTSIDEFYELVAAAFHPTRSYRRLLLPLWAGRVSGGFISAATRALGRNRPLIDPTLYAVHSMAANLDFSNARFTELLRRAGRVPVTRELGISELNK